MRRSLLAALAIFAACTHSAVPDDALRHNLEGVRLLREGRVDEARAHFELALEYRPRFAEARANLGVVFLTRGELDEAEACFRQAVAHDADLSVAHSNLGVVLERRERAAQAMSAYRAALAVDPAAYEARFNLARLLVMKGDAHGARLELLRLHVQHPHDLALIGALALVEARLGDLPSARRRVHDAAAREESHPLMHLARGVVLASDGDVDGAIAALELARADPALEAMALARLVSLHRLAGREAEAAEAARLLPERSLSRAVAVAPERL
jgi:Flp pilus assembly protein TadD